MNWVLILVVAILAGYAIAGYAKGFLKIVFSLISWILVLAVIYWASPQIEIYLKENTPVYEKIVEHCEKSVREKTMQQLEQEKDGKPIDRTDNEYIQKLLEKLPEEALEKFFDGATTAVDQYMQEQGVYTALAIRTADIVMKCICFIISLIIGSIISAIVQQMLGFIGNLPLIGFTNRICGLLAGALNGLILVWVLFAVVSLFGSTEFGEMITSYINESEFLVWLYEKNILNAFIA